MYIGMCMCKCVRVCVSTNKMARRLKVLVLKHEVLNLISGYHKKAGKTLL